MKVFIVYNNKVGNKTLCPRTFYVLYVKPNQESNGHLIYRLDMDQIVDTKNYQTIPVPEDIDHMFINDEDQYTQEAEKVLRSSLLISLRNKFLLLSILVSLQYGFYGCLYSHLYNINFYSHLYLYLYEVHIDTHIQ